MRGISSVVNDRKPLFLFTILAKLTLTGAKYLFTELCDTLTNLRLFYEHRRNVVKLSNISRTSTTDTVQQTVTAARLKVLGRNNTHKV